MFEPKCHFFSNEASKGILINFAKLAKKEGNLKLRL